MSHYTIPGGLGYLYSFPSQPYIEEAITNAILAFNTDLLDGISYQESRYSKLCIVNIMTAVEAVIQTILYSKAIHETKKSKIIKHICTPSENIGRGGILWEEVQLVRNCLIYAHIYETKNGKEVPIEPIRKFLKRKSDYINTHDNRTISLSFSLIPDNVGRYECIGALTFWEWLRKNVLEDFQQFPFLTSEEYAIVISDPRIMDKKGLDKWLDMKKFDKYFQRNGSMKYFLALISSRLPKSNKDVYKNNTNELLETDCRSSK